jgi:hypothetical protein
MHYLLFDPHRVPVSSDEEDGDNENNSPFTMPGPEATKEEIRDVCILDLKAAYRSDTTGAVV